MDDTEILIIGAGLAGLRCADVLTSAGRDVSVWEAEDAVGGRIRTDVIDEFRCDRGFQVLNPAYPELRRALDLSALRLQSFGAGVVVRRDEGSAVWVHPLRDPKKVPVMIRSGGIAPGDLLALTRWAAPALRPKALKEHSRPDSSLAQALDHAGVTGELRRVIDRFLAGVLLDDAGASSNKFALLLLRMFALGVPALPADGMRALPRQLATKISDRIALRRKVSRIDRDAAGWRVHGDGVTVRARQVVVATGAAVAAALTAEPAPPMRAVLTDWWATDQPVAGPPMLRVDGRATPPGPVLNAAVISAAAPTYAPPGQHLIAASALVDADGAWPPERVMRAHAADMLQSDPRRWQPLIRNEVRDALPAQCAPLNLRRPIRDAAGIWLCGDHRDSASIQGALVSGRRTAEAILRTTSATR